MADLIDYGPAVVTGIHLPKGKSRTYKVTLNDGGQYDKTFQVWATAFQSDDPHPALAPLRQAMDNEQQVRVQYTTKQETFNGNTYPRNTIHEVEIVGEATEADWSSSDEGAGVESVAATSPVSEPTDPELAALLQSADAIIRDLDNLFTAIKGWAAKNNRTLEGAF